MQTPIDLAYEDIANAIVKQAADDYLRALNGVSYCEKSPEWVIKDTEKFFRSNYFKKLTTLDGEQLIQMLQAEYREKKGLIMKVTLVQATANPIETIANIAGICYDSNPVNHLGLVKHLYSNGHHSVFEHIYFTFKIEGISRACSHQLVRHRHCSFTQRSQRYCKEVGRDSVTPSSVCTEYCYGTYKDELENIERAYEKLIADGVPKEDARYLLPNATTTDLYLSCNLRELIHIANERLCTRAQWEIRELVKQMVSLVAPELQFMLVPKCKSGWMICNMPCNKQKESEKDE